MEDSVYNTPEGWHNRHPSIPHLGSLLEYKTLYNESIHNPSAFWAQQARSLLTFDHDFHTTQNGSLASGDSSWFLGGQLNASFNCIDRHAIQDLDRTAIIYEADEPDAGRNISYGELLREVCRLAWFLRVRGVRKGDIVTIYMPMIPEAIYAVMACARIGAVHSVVFGGFSADALRDRITDAQSKVIITADEGVRGGKIVQMKRIVDEAVSTCGVLTVLTFKHTGGDISWTERRDVWWHEETDKYPAYIAPEPMDSEDPLFLLYTSGSTGKAKGILHSTAGYLLGAAVTGKYVFDIHSEDRFFCGGDIGWITGHAYVVYAPLLLGCTTVVFESTPVHPSPSRYWDVIAKHSVTHFYVAPTALRLLKRADNAIEMNHDMSHLRVLGSVGEPIAPEVWKWFHDYVGKGKAHITDTYWQTETGSHLIAPLAGVTPMKPGSASLPCFGIEPAIIDPISGEELKGNNVDGVLAIKQPWPSMARTCYGDHRRYMENYLNVYKGYYFTGDSAHRDNDGYYWIRGRVDDVINVSGHRVSTAEIEGALLEHPNIAEAAVIGIPHELTGQAINTVVALKTPNTADGIEKELILQVRKSIGPFAAPKRVLVVRDLPKTRSGKIMRRILRKVLSGDMDLGDISTLIG
ncbi:hypothetical protein AWENTII_006367 [Aspergillus wentii]